MKDKIFEGSHITKIRVRYADTDKMGIVYNAMYFVYFEVGRTEMMRQYALPYTEFEKAGYILPVIETYSKFKSPAFYDDILEIESTLKFEYKPFIRFDYNIFRGNTTIAIGYTVHSFLNAETQKPVKPPEIFVKALAEANKLNR